jgi:DNA polymerase III subunit epsilon
MNHQTFSILDLETTGGSPYFDRIIEVGLLRVEHGEVTRTYSTLINPGIEIPEFITEITGIRDSDLIGAPTFDEIKEELVSHLEDSVLVAHNSGFDYGFLAAEFERCGWEFSMDSLCTVRLSRVLFPEYRRHNLDAIIERHGFKVKNRHRALDDTKVLWEFLQMVQDEFPSDQLNKAFERTILKIAPKKQRKLDIRPDNELTYIYEEGI